MGAQAPCAFLLKDVVSEKLGESLIGGHTINVSYQLTPAAEASGTAVTAVVSAVKVEARRDTLSAKLDSARPADLKRVEGGADALPFFEAVNYFALLNQKLVFHLDERGALRSVEGAEAVRQRLLNMHPEKPRTEPHAQAKVALKASDKALAAIFLPYVTALPAEGPLTDPRLEEGEAAVDLGTTTANGFRGVRVRRHQGKVWVEEKWALQPSPAASSVPNEPGAPTRSFLVGDRQLTVALPPDDICFEQAGWSENLNHLWKGLIEEALVETEEKRTQTRVWTRP